MVCVAMVVVGCAPSATSPASQPAQAVELRMVKHFVGGGEGGWDYLTVDPQARRVYVARANRVMVFDADAGKLLGEVAGTSGVHGVAIVPDRNEGYATDGKDGMISVFDLKTFATIRTIKAGTKPDAILYDPASKKVFAFNGASGDVTVVDPAAPDKAPATLMIGGKLEFGATDGEGKVYVNVEDKSELVAIDSKQLKIVGRWPIAPGTEPTGLAIDAAHRRLFVGCLNQKMIVVDADNGNILAALPVGAGVDGAAFDAQLGLAVSANGKDGTMTAVSQGADGKFKVVQTVVTVKTARTVANDPKTHCFYLPCNMQDAAGKMQFCLIVVGPAK